MLRETKKFIGKSLQPARPVHHLPPKQASAIPLNFETELPSNTELPEMAEVKILTQAMIPCQPNQHESEEKKERIKYSRDFLLKLSSVSLSQKKPEFLPDHPIVLEKPPLWLLEGCERYRLILRTPCRRADVIARNYLNVAVPEISKEKSNTFIDISKK